MKQKISIDKFEELKKLLPNINGDFLYFLTLEVLRKNCLWKNWVELNMKIKDYGKGNNNKDYLDAITNSHFAKNYQIDLKKVNNDFLRRKELLTYLFNSVKTEE